MAKKKGLAAYKKTKRAKKNNAIVKAKSNPPPMKDLLDFVIPGFVGYAGTKLTSRVVHAAVARKSPKWAKHASVLSSIGSATGAMLLAHRFERTKEYAAPIIVGARRLIALQRSRRQWRRPSDRGIKGKQKKGMNSQFRG